MGCQTVSKIETAPKEDVVISTPTPSESQDVSLAPAPIVQPSNHPLLPYQRYVLDNGLRVIIKEIHSAPIVAVDIWVGTGAADEEPHEIGISHFLEHMFFKGTEKRPAGQMDLEIKSLGGYNNAATSYDYTHYYVVLPSEHYLKALDILSDAVLNSTFPQEEIEREREVVLREIDRKEDSPWGKLFTEFLEKVFAENPYGRPILGTQETLAPIDHDAFMDYIHRAYQPSNLVVVITGDIDHDEALKNVKEIFSDLPSSKPVLSEPFKIPEPEQPTEFTIEKDVQGTYLVVGYPTPPLRGTSAEYALDVAASILGEGRSSWLYQILKEEKGLVTDSSSFFWTLERAGLFGMEAACEAEDLQEVEQILFEQIEKLRQGEFTDAEIQKAKNQIISDFAFSTEKAVAIAGTYGEFEVTSSIDEAVHYTDEVRKVTRKDIVDALQQYVKPNAYTKGVLPAEYRSLNRFFCHSERSEESQPYEILHSHTRSFATLRMTI